MSGEFQTVSALHLKLFQGQWLFKRKLSSGARRNGENSKKRMNLPFTMLIFAWSMTVRVKWDCSNAIGRCLRADLRLGNFPV